MTNSCRHIHLILGCSFLAGCATLPAERAENELSVGLGASPWNWGDLGKTTGHSLGTVAARFQSPLGDSERWVSFRDVSAVVLTHTPTDIVPRNQCPPVTNGFNASGETTSQYLDRCAKRFVNSYGFGVAPLGTRVSIVSRPNLRAQLEASAGAVLFDRQTPYPGTTSFNLSAELGASLTFHQTWPVSTNTTVGYRFVHYSNAGLASFNPGIGLQVLTVSWPLTTSR